MKIAAVMFVLAVLFTFSSHIAIAQTLEDQPQLYERVLVLGIIDEGVHDDGGTSQPFQHLRVRWLTGPSTGETTEMEYTGVPGRQTMARLQLGETAVVTNTLGTNEFYPTEPYRLPALLGLAIFLVVVATIAAGWRAVGAVVGLVLSGVVIAFVVVPLLLRGVSPLPVIALGAGGVAALNLFLAHGFRRQTVIACAGTFITLALAVGLSLFAITVARLFGMGSETSFFVQLATNGRIDLSGVLLGGLIIGVIGVLDDITSAQVAVVDELRTANPSFRFTELFAAASRVGREHIASMMNTLVLAYAGASLPLFLLVAVSAQPVWVAVNTETIAEEIVRMLVGSIALVAAVPLTTALAAYLYTRHRR